MVRSMIKQKLIVFGGHRSFKIYGTLRCRSGKKMLPANRVFFISEQEARDQGYRPCAHCLHADYKKWKNGIIR